MEGRRTLGSPGFWAVLGLLILFNAAFFLYNRSVAEGDLTSYRQSYDQLLKELMPLGIQDARQAVKDWQEYRKEQSLLNPYWITLENHWEQVLVYNQLEKQLDYLDYYPKYLEKIQTEARQMQSVSIFAKPGTVSYENALKTARDFGQMTAEGIRLGHDLAVTTVFDDPLGDFSVLVLLGFVCALFLQERKRGLWELIHSTPGGRRQLALKRSGCLLAASVIGTFAIIGSRILLAAAWYGGLGEWGCPLQSVEMFFNVPIPLTVEQFWLFYLIMKTLGNYLIVLLLWLVLSAFANINLAVVAAALILGAEYALTFLVPSSALVLLRYLNIFSFFNYRQVFVNYLNLPVFGLLIRASRLIAGLLLPLTALLIMGNILIAEKKYPVEKTNRILLRADKLAARLEKRHRGKSLFGWELYKLYGKRLGLLLLVLLFIWAQRLDGPYRYSSDPLREALTEFYARKYAGPLTQEKKARMEEEAAALTSEENKAALQQLLAKTERLSGEKWIVPTHPYEAIWSDNLGNYHRTTALIVLLFLTLLISPLESQERQADMTVLHHSAAAGRKRLWGIKTRLCLLSAFWLWLIVYGTELWHTQKSYGAFSCLDAPMSALEGFSDWKISIGAALLLYYGLKLLTLIAAAFVIRWLSGLVRSNKTALLLGLLLLILPAVLLTIGVEGTAWFSLLKPLGTAELFFRPLPFALVALAGTAALILSRYRDSRG